MTIVRVGLDGNLRCDDCAEIVVRGEEHQCKDAVWRATLGVGKFPAEQPTSDVDKILDERGSRYGVFAKHATIAQELKEVVDRFDKGNLEADQSEALDMICHKIARIINGDPNYADSWVDIAGYAMLVADRLEGKAR